MIDPSQKYREALAAFGAPGGRWVNKGALTYWGKAAGLSADEIIADARAAGVADRDADIRRGWADARPKGEAAHGAYARAKPKPQPPKYKNLVRKIIGDLQTAERANVDWLRELSSDWSWFGVSPEISQTAAFVRAAFRPEERLFVFRSDKGTVGKPGVNIRPAREWVRDIGAMLAAGDLVKTNPFTGERGRTKNGQSSYVSQDCLASYSNALLEFDGLPLPVQFAFWRNFVLTSPLAPSLVSVTFSGGKSLHGLLHVGAVTPDEWQRIRARLLALFAADDDARFRIDPQALHPLIGTRMPGATRCGSSARQTLVYLNPTARSGNGWESENDL